MSQTGETPQGHPQPPAGWTPSSLPPSSLPPSTISPLSVPPTSVPPTSVPPYSLTPPSTPPTSVPTITLPRNTAGAGSTAVRRRSNRRVLGGVALGVAVVLGVGAGLAWNALRPKADLGLDRARDYLTALSQDRATDALALAGPLPVGDRTLLTEAVLRAGHEAWPMTDLRVARVDDATVEATWRLGDEEVRQRLALSEGDDPHPVTPVAQVSFSHMDPSVPVRVAGLALPSPTVLLFPGRYPVTTTSEHLTYGDGSVRVGLDGSSDASTLALSATDAGRTAFQAAVQAAIEACVAQQTLAPAGCPFSYQPAPGETVDGATVAWQLGSPLPMPTRLDVTDPRSTTADIDVTLVVTAKTKEGAIDKPLKVTLHPLVDLTQPRPRATWR